VEVLSIITADLEKDNSVWNERRVEKARSRLKWHAVCKDFLDTTSKRNTEL
jgi:hypothetical protein